MGFKTADIAKEMGVPYSRVQALRRKAVSIITEVENRINTRITKCREADSVAPTYQSPGESAVKTVGGKRVQLSGQSIVEPYREIVIKLWKEGGNHRTIYPVLQTEGYTGSKNAIYQYILKLGKELPDVMNRECKIKTPGGETDDGFDVAAAESRSGLKIERVARNNVYRGILKEASEQRKKENEAASGESPAEPENKQLDNVSENKGGVRPAMSKHSPLDENTLSIMYGQDSPSVGGESETKEKKTF